MRRVEVLLAKQGLLDRGCSGVWARSGPVAQGGGAPVGLASCGARVLMRAGGARLRTGAAGGGVSDGVARRCADSQSRRMVTCLWRRGCWGAGLSPRVGCHRRGQRGQRWARQPARERRRLEHAAAGAARTQGGPAVVAMSGAKGRTWPLRRLPSHRHLATRCVVSCCVHR